MRMHLMVVAACLSAGPALANGAVAHSREGGDGISYGYPNQQAAEAMALRECGHDSCRIVGNFLHMCGAIARGTAGGAWAAARGGQAAVDAALSKCEAKSGYGKCRSVASGCDY